MPRFDLQDYVPVQERVKQFWNDYPSGRIITTLMSDPHDFTVCRYRAEVYRDAEDMRPAATGFAFEQAGGNSANATSHEENCESSCIGRALANLGYATSYKDRPSREEMTKAARQSGSAGPQAEPPWLGNDYPHDTSYSASGPTTTQQRAPATRQEATPRQIKFLHAVAREAGISDSDLEQRAQDAFGMELAALGRRDTSTLIEQMQAERAAMAGVQ